MWAIAKPVVRARAHVTHGGKTVVEHVICESYGLHESNVAAKRAYIVSLEPSLADASDDFIRHYWRGVPRRAHDMKIVRVARFSP